MMTLEAQTLVGAELYLRYFYYTIGQGTELKVTGSALLVLTGKMKCKLICTPCAPWANSELDLKNMRADTFS